MFHNNRVAHHTTSYLRWVVSKSREVEWMARYAERAAVELVRRGKF